MSRDRFKPVKLDPAATLERFRELFGHDILERYGMSETVMLTSNPCRATDGERRGGSVGRPLPGVRVRVVDDQDHLLAAGQTGHVQVKGPNVFKGYWRNPEKTAEAFRGEWCSVGDMARRDEDGYIWLVDRKSNMIISGGENIYPSEVEGVLGAHPQVKDVAVIGIPHDKWGETVQAVVVLHEGQTGDVAGMTAWCRERLAAFKCPRSIVFISDTDMPRTATGKILHRVLRQRIQPLDAAA